MSLHVSTAINPIFPLCCENCYKQQPLIYWTSSDYKSNRNAATGYHPPSRLAWEADGKEKCFCTVKNQTVNLPIDGWSNIHMIPFIYSCITTSIYLLESTETSGNLLDMYIKLFKKNARVSTRAKKRKSAPRAKTHYKEWNEMYAPPSLHFPLN